MIPVFIFINPTSVWNQRESHVSGIAATSVGKSQNYDIHNRSHFKTKKSVNPKTHLAPTVLGMGSFQGASQEEHWIWLSVPALQGPSQCLTSVWRMAALCSLAVSDSLSTSMCCLQSEFWLLRVSSFVCKARSSDSFLESSCFSWSICKTRRQSQNLRKFCSNTYTWQLVLSLFLMAGDYKSSKKCYESA